MSNEKQSLGLGFVRRFDLDVTIRAMLAYGEFIGQCMDDARAEERKRCIALVCPTCATGDRPTYTTAGTGGVQPEPMDWYHSHGYGIRMRCKAAGLYEKPNASG